MNFLSSREFKALQRKGPRDARGLGVRKSTIDTVTKLDDRTLRFTISTGAIDRDMDTISVGGWDLANFERNPVVLWSHRADEPPIGKAVDFGTTDNRLYSAVQFLPATQYGSASDLAEMLYRMACDGYLSATSVGFRPIKWDYTQDKERAAESMGWPGIDFEQQELVELSIVSVPSNPEALIETLIEPGGGQNDSAAVISPAPVQVLNYEHERERRKRLYRAAMLGVIAART